MASASARVSAIVGTKWLADKLASNPGNLRVLDGSWHLPPTRRNARQEFYNKHIPGSQFFEIDECCDKSSDLGHMLPQADLFEQYVGRLGISNDTHIVIYDNNDSFGLFSAQRVWWTFRVFGHDLVSVMEGGLRKWESEGLETIDEVNSVEPQAFKATFRPHLVKSFADVEKNIDEKTFNMVDARPAGRFDGTSPEPRAGIKPGHMPGSINLPFPNLLNLEARTMKSPEEIKALFDEKNIDLSQAMTASCGSGISACLIALGAYVCGAEDVAVYDGAWTEWFQRAKREHIISK